MKRIRGFHLKGNREKRSKGKRKPIGRLSKFLYMGENAMHKYADRMAMKGRQ